MTSTRWKTKGILAGIGILVAIAAAFAARRGEVRPVRPARPIAGPPGTTPPAPPPPIAAPAPEEPPAPPPPPAPPVRPKVELVFVLDTTGSMTGLIEGAKRKIWSIANHAASGQPTPDVRIGLVAYRDRGDAYVTRKVPLSSDLDAVYGRLTSFHADGGGDTPEHVAKALHDAVHGMQWSADAMKMVFLVGDAPPHTDYDDGFDLARIVRAARRKEIVLTTIRCGRDPRTEAVWRELAAAGRGTYASIEQSGGMEAVVTPYDDRLAALSRRLNGTAVLRGGEEARARMAHKAALAAGTPAASAADRAGYYAKTGAALDRDDLVAAGAPPIEAVREEELPAELRALDAAGRRAVLEAKQRERAAILRAMRTLSARREAYLRAEAGKRAPTGFDEVVTRSISTHAKRYGLAY